VRRTLCRMAEELFMGVEIRRHRAESAAKTF
jgi:hypothetical protein